MSSNNTILVSGATGKQGGAVIAALLRAKADAQILALTRSKDSAAAKKLAENPNVRIVEGTFDDPTGLFDKAGKVDQFFLMTTPSSFNEKGCLDEERQGKALVDAALASNVSQIVFTSVNRHGDVPTDVPHFKSKHSIEEHLIKRAGDKVKWTIVRPVFFMDNFSTDVFGKVTSAAWAHKLGFDKPLQMVAVKDIGEVAALALLSPDKFNHKKIDLAGDSLTLNQVEAMHKRVRGTPLPRTFTTFGWAATKASKDLGLMFDFFRDVGYDSDIPACRRIYPGLQNLEQFLQAKK